MRVFSRIIKFLLMVMTIFVVSVALQIVSYAAESQTVKSDAAIILGAGIMYDKPSPVFRERINHGVLLYKEGKVKKLIFTGGLGKGESFTESEVAKEYAIQSGVRTSDILIDKKSKITYENILEAKNIMLKNNLHTALIVSDPLHMRRAMTMALDMGVNAHSAPTPTSMYRSWTAKTKFLFREIYFYIGYLFNRFLY